MNKILRICVSICVLFCVIGYPISKAHAATTFSVNTLVDENDGECSPAGIGDGDCSIRDALDVATDGDTISFGVNGTLTLAAGEITISENLIINGPGANFLTIDAAENSRVVKIIGASNVTIKNLTISNGKVMDDDGGGIYNAGTLTLENVAITGNKAVRAVNTFSEGGGVYSSGPLTVRNSTFSNNEANFTGGGIAVIGNAVLENTNFVSNFATGNGGGGNGGGFSATNSNSVQIDFITFSLNEAVNGGGAYINNVNSLDITNSTFEDNKAHIFTGGIILSGAFGTYTITNSTISGNQQIDIGGGGNGGIWVDAQDTMVANLNHLTITNNTDIGTNGGAGLFTSQIAPAVKNSIIAGNISTNTTDEDCKGTIDSLNYNLIQDADENCVVTGTATNNETGDPLLNPIASNSGATKTHSLQALSPALNAIPLNTNGCGNFFFTDQRNVQRPQGSGCEIGAYEDASPRVSSIVRLSASPTNLATVDFTVSFTEDVSNVDTSDFIPSTTGVVGAAVTTVTPVSASIYTISVNTGTDTGTIRLDMQGTATINDANGNSIADVPYNSGESYTKVATATLRSVGINDGFLLESTETSTTGGTINNTATTFILGDDASDRQYRALLHFDTSSLPDTAVITSAILQIKKQSTSGSNPFSILGSLRIDSRKPDFGAPTLEIADFKSSAAKNNIATFSLTPVSNWYSGTFNSTGMIYISRTGTTQFKIYFSTGDNDDNGVDIIKFYSGNAGLSNRPKLIIQYYVP